VQIEAAERTASQKLEELFAGERTRDK